MATSNYNSARSTPTAQMSNAKTSFAESEIPMIQVAFEMVVLLLKVIWLVLVSTVKMFIPVREKSVKGEIVVITGAGHGIGRELAFQYASRGAIVVCLDINRQGNEETVKEIGGRWHSKAFAYVCDVVNREEVFTVAAQIEKDVGVVSILINNAGILHSEELLKTTPDKIENTLKVNVLSHFWTLQAFLPKMLEFNHGHIVCLSSCAGLLGMKHLVPYCSSKYAVRGLMDALHQELRVNPRCNIKLTTIYPHLVDTGLCKKPVLRLPRLTPAITPIGAARHIISAQCRNIQESSIPSSYLRMNTITRLFPKSVGDALFDFVGIYLKPDS